MAAATTSGNVNVATEVVGASAGERANLDKESGGRENEEGPQGGKFEGVGNRGGLVTPQQLVKGRIGALWIGRTAEELEDLNAKELHNFVHQNRVPTLEATPQCPSHWMCRAFLVGNMQDPWEAVRRRPRPLSFQSSIHPRQLPRRHPPLPTSWTKPWRKERTQA